MTKSEAVPMRRYCGSIGRTAQGTTFTFFAGSGIWVWAMRGGLRHCEADRNVEEAGHTRRRVATSTRLSIVVPTTTAKEKGKFELLAEKHAVEG